MEKQGETLFSSLWSKRRRDRGNVGIPQGFARRVGRVESGFWLSRLSIRRHFHGQLVGPPSQIGVPDLLYQLDS